MGVQPSKTELYLPSQTLRECHPDRCWCDRPYHRTSRYVYVERGGDGRERYADPVDIFSQFLVGGGPAPQMPWRDPRSWTVRDYEKLGEVMEEWASREFGKSHGSSSSRGSGGGGGYPPWPGGGGGGGYWDGEYGRQGGSRRSRRYVPWDQFEDLKANFQHMASQYQRHMSEQEAFLFGSDADRRKEQYRQNMLNQLKEMMPQLVQMLSTGATAQQQQPLQYTPGQPMPGMMPNPMMPWAGAMPPIPGAMPGPATVQNPMQAAATMNGMMGNPMAAAAGMQQAQGMPPMGVNPAMMNGGAGGIGLAPGMMNPGMMDQQQPMPSIGMSRRARRRNNFNAFDDGFDDEYEDYRPRRGGFRRRGRDWRDDEDMLGGFAGGIRGPRGPGGGGPPPPMRPSGGMAFDDTDASPQRREGAAGYGAPNPQGQRPRVSNGPPIYEDEAGGAGTYDFSPPLRRPNYSAADMATAIDGARNNNTMQGVDETFAETDDPIMGRSYNPSAFQAAAGAVTAGRDAGYMSSTPMDTNASAYGISTYASAATAADPITAATSDPYSLRSAMKRGVSFVPQVATETAHLTRPRAEEVARGEPSAGALPDKRDGLRKGRET